jgi:hypothetical protein
MIISRGKVNTKEQLLALLQIVQNSGQRDYNGVIREKPGFVLTPGTREIRLQDCVEDVDIESLQEEFITHVHQQGPDEYKVRRYVTSYREKAHEQAMFFVRLMEGFFPQGKGKEEMEQYLSLWPSEIAFGLLGGFRVYAILVWDPTDPYVVAQLSSPGNIKEIIKCAKTLCNTPKDKTRECILNMSEAIEVRKEIEVRYM